MHRRRPGHRLGLGADLRVLVLGGTAFLGRHLVEAALERGDRVTILNRGRTNPGLFPGVEHLVGDRNGDLSALAAGEWDACIDPSAYFPRQVRAAADLLSDRVGHYTLISSISVYPLEQPDKSEAAPTIALQNPGSEDVDRDYGALKAACEREAAAAYGPGRVLVSRSGWVLAPSAPDYTVQFIHARDQADWILDCAERRVTGIYNCTGPERPLPLGRLLDACRAVARSDATFTWVPDEFLTEHEVGPWMEMPLWIPAPLGSLHNAPIDRALAAGLHFRSLEQTIGETLAWARAHALEPVPPDSTGRVRPVAGLAPEKEQAVLAAWHAQL